MFAHKLLNLKKYFIFLKDFNTVCPVNFFYLYTCLYFLDTTKYPRKTVFFKGPSTSEIFYF